MIQAHTFGHAGIWVLGLLLIIRVEGFGFRDFRTGTPVVGTWVLGLQDIP